MKKLIYSAIALSLVGALSAQNVVNLEIGTPHTENFDLTGAGSTIDGAIPNALGYYTDQATILSGTGSANTGGTYSFATATAPDDRAMGCLGSNSQGDNMIALRIRNNTGAPIGRINFEYFAELYRASNPAGAQPTEWIVDYFLNADPFLTDADFKATYVTTSGVFRSDKINATQISNGTPSALLYLLNSYAFPSAGASALDGNADVQKLEATLLFDRDDTGSFDPSIGTNGTGPEAWQPGQDLVIRWIDRNNAGNDGAIAVDNVRIAAVESTNASLAGSLSLADTVFGGPFGRDISYSVVQGDTTIASGTVNLTASTADYTIAVPASAIGDATIIWNGSSFLRRLTSVSLTGGAVSVEAVTLLNGDVDNSGEVDAADIDLVIAEFGSVSDTASDVDVSGEVDAADIDIVIANFGSVDE